MEKNLVERLKSVKLIHECLPICNYCKNIRISSNPGWMSREQDSELYDILMVKYGENNLTFGICPPCVKKGSSEFGDY